jgi:hypothetical protein
LGTIVEDVADMSIALTAGNRGSHHAKIRISDLDNVLIRKDLPEAGPARPRIEFRRRAEERGIAAHASEESRGVDIPTIPGIGTLRTRLSSDLI